MDVRFVDLLQRDHDDISSLLETIVTPSAPLSLVIDALDGLRLAVLVHTVAQVRTMRSLSQLQPVPRVRELAAEICREHVVQQWVVDTLVRANLFKPAWCHRALVLREQMAAHAISTDRAAVELADSVPPHLQAHLARTYATERMKVLGTTAPARLVSELDAV